MPRNKWRRKQRLERLAAQAAAERRALDESLTRQAFEHAELWAAHRPFVPYDELVVALSASVEESDAQ